MTVTHTTPEQARDIAKWAHLDSYRDDIKPALLSLAGQLEAVTAKLAALEGQEHVQPMTIDEVNDAWAAASHHHHDEMDVFALVRAVEAHHGIKGARE